MKLTARIKARVAPPPTSTANLLAPKGSELQALVAQWCNPQYIRSVETTMDYQSAGMVVRVEYLVPHLALMEIKA